MNGSFKSPFQAVGLGPVRLLNTRPRLSSNIRTFTQRPEVGPYPAGPASPIPEADRAKLPPNDAVAVDRLCRMARESKEAKTTEGMVRHAALFLDVLDDQENESRVIELTKKYCGDAAGHVQSILDRRGRIAQYLQSGKKSDLLKPTEPPAWDQPLKIRLPVRPLMPTVKMRESQATPTPGSLRPEPYSEKPRAQGLWDGLAVKPPPVIQTQTSGYSIDLQRQIDSYRAKEQEVYGKPTPTASKPAPPPPTATSYSGDSSGSGVCPPGQIPAYPGGPCRLAVATRGLPGLPGLIYGSGVATPGNLTAASTVASYGSLGQIPTQLLIPGRF